MRDAKSTSRWKWTDMVSFPPYHSGSSLLSSERANILPAEGTEKDGFAPNAFAPTFGCRLEFMRPAYGIERFFILQTLSLPE